MSKQKQSGHYCRICGRHRANEKFGGKGHHIHVCKDCQREQEEKKRLLKKARQRAAEVGLHPPKRPDMTRTQVAQYLGVTPSAFDYWRSKLGIEPYGTYEGRLGTGYLYDIEAVIRIYQACTSESHKDEE